MKIAMKFVIDEQNHFKVLYYDNWLHLVFLPRRTYCSYYCDSYLNRLNERLWKLRYISPIVVTYRTSHEEKVYRGGTNYALEKVSIGEITCKEWLEMFR